MKVLIIPEDPTNDQYILRPILARLLEDAGISCKDVEVLTDPHLRGVEQALKPDIVRGVIVDNPMVDLFVLMLDRDCDRQGNEAKARDRVAEHQGKLLACLARHEVEVWALALHRAALSSPWTEIRAHCDPKEAYFDPFITAQRWGGPGGGRKRAMRELLARHTGLLKLCDELAELQTQLRAWKRARGRA